MKFKSWQLIKEKKTFRIVEDNPDVGAYLYVFEEDKCVFDYLQKDVDTCKALALEEFAVELDSWIEIE
jgi:hypothetical protein